MMGIKINIGIWGETTEEQADTSRQSVVEASFRTKSHLGVRGWHEEIIPSPTPRMRYIFISKTKYHKWGRVVTFSIYPKKIYSYKLTSLIYPKRYSYKLQNLFVCEIASMHT